jgi:CHAT domain-containing protein/Tfp pilus assembly protein PilF
MNPVAGQWTGSFRDSAFLVAPRVRVFFLSIVSFGGVVPRLLLTSFLVSPAFGQSPISQQSSILHEAKAKIMPGVVVEKVVPYSEGGKVGLRAGDILLSWIRGDSHGEIQSPFDLLWTETEEAPLGIVKLEGLRGTEKQVWSLGPADWGLTARPNFTGQLLSAYLEAQKLAKSTNAGEIMRASTRWKDLVDQYPASKAGWIPAWLLFHAAESLKKARQWKEADDFYQSAVQHAAGTGPVIEGQLLRAWAKAHEQRNDWANAERYFEQSTAKLEISGKGKLAIAVNLNALGTISWQRGQLDRSEEYFRRALQIGMMQAPGSLAVATSLNNLGIVADERGDLSTAEQYYRQGLEIREKQAPGSLAVATSLNNLGVVAWERGDLAAAEQYYRQVLATEEKQAPGSLDAAVSLNNLGVLARKRGDLSEAEQYHRQALDIREKQAPGSLAVAASLNNLGLVAEERGDLASAEQYYRQALATEEKQASGSLDVAISLNNLGTLEFDRGDLAEAEQHQLQAFAIYEKSAPASIDAAENFRRLGDVTRKTGDLARAEQYYRRAVAIQEKLAPGSQLHAESLAAVASVLREQGQLQAAAQFYAQAVTALESQIARLGGSEEARSGFRANHAYIYREYVGLLLAQKQAERALEVLEHSWAQTFLEMLAASHVDIGRGVDPKLLEQERSLRADIRAKSNRRIQLLSAQHSEDQVAAVQKEMEALFAQYQDVAEQIRVSSPGYAALMQPKALTAAGLQQFLDADTLLLEYTLGDERSHVLAVTQNTVTGYELAKRVEIEDLAREVYQLLSARRRVDGETELHKEARLAKAEAKYPSAVAQLSRLVLGPIAAQIAGKQRILVVADGALLYIPFAALPDPESVVDPKQRPLIVDHEIVYLPSASVVAVLRQQAMGRKEPRMTIAVLADPVFDKEDARVESLKDATRSGKEDSTSSSTSVDEETMSRSLAELTRSATAVGLPRLPRLLFSRREAQAIAALAPREQVMEALDFDASRETATSDQLAQYQIIHFATHGLVDSEHPELSGLVLSLVDQQGHRRDGFLQLNDIYNLNLPADLVVLSACQTALGKEIRGEGLVGLTRGFMYAGATRVVASLWSVNDAATAEFMKRFYQGILHDGLSPARALQRAQIEMWQQKAWANPYYWAAFQIQGDWR